MLPSLVSRRPPPLGGFLPLLAQPCSDPRQLIIPCTVLSTLMSCHHHLFCVGCWPAIINHAPHTPRVCREVVLDPASDDFFRSHLYANYGEVGLDVKEMLDRFAAASAQHKQVRCWR